MNAKSQVLPLGSYLMEMGDPHRGDHRVRTVIEANGRPHQALPPDVLHQRPTALLGKAFLADELGDVGINMLIWLVTEPFQQARSVILQVEIHAVPCRDGEISGHTCPILKEDDRQQPTRPHARQEHEPHTDERRCRPGITKSTSSRPAL